MNDITFLSDDSFYRVGVEFSINELKPGHYKNVIIIDDGNQFLYVVDVMGLANADMPSNEVDLISYFLNNLKKVIPRNVSAEKLKRDLEVMNYVSQRHKKLSPREYYVLFDLARGFSSRKSQANMGVKYKTWHNIKRSGLERLGFKHANAYMLAINTWLFRGYSLALTQMPRDGNFHQTELT